MPPGSSFPHGEFLILPARAVRNEHLRVRRVFPSKSCRHAPHGIGPPSQTRHDRHRGKFFFPSVNALNSATRSAQHVKP